MKYTRLCMFQEIGQVPCANAESNGYSSYKCDVRSGCKRLVGKRLEVFLLLCLVMQCLFSHRLLQILSSENHLLCCHRQILLAHYLLQKPCKLLSNRWHDTFADIQLCCTKLNNQFFSYFRHLISRLVSASLILLRRIPL